MLSLAVLADGRLASGGRDGNIKLWPKDGTGEPVVRSQGSPVTSLAVLPDGRLASAGRDVRLWPKDGMGDPVVLAHGGPVWSLAGWRMGGWPVAAPMATSSSGSLTNRNWSPPSVFTRAAI